MKSAPARARGEAGGIPAGAYAAVLAFVAILVAVVFAITSGGSSGSSPTTSPGSATATGGSATATGGSATATGGSATTEVPSGSLAFRPVDGCTLLTDGDVQLLTDSQGIQGHVTGSRSSFSNDIVEALTPPGPGWVTECDWAADITVPAGDKEDCFWGGKNEPGITVSLAQRIDPNEAAAVSYLRSLSSTALQPDHSLDGATVGNGAIGDLTVEMSYIRWDPATVPVLPPKGCEMGSGPVATLYVLTGGSRLGAGITATLTISVYSQWDQMWGHSPPLTALAAVAETALKKLPS
jgi:hypothetical protein